MAQPEPMVELHAIYCDCERCQERVVLLKELESESCQRSPYFKSTVSQQNGGNCEPEARSKRSFIGELARGSAQPKSGAAGRLETRKP